MNKYQRVAHDLQPKLNALWALLDSSEDMQETEYFQGKYETTIEYGQALLEEHGLEASDIYDVPLDWGSDSARSVYADAVAE